MDLRSSPQNLENPSRSSSIASQPDEMEARNNAGPLGNDRSHKLDLYSIPVFLLEALVLIGLAYLGQYVHFQYNHKPLISGFYCDDISYRQQFVETKLTRLFSQPQNELTVVVLLLAIPIVLVSMLTTRNSSPLLQNTNLHSSQRSSSANWSTPCLARSSSAKSERYAPVANFTLSLAVQSGSRAPTCLVS